jgi:hypothetical protein
MLSRTTDRLRGQRVCVCVCVCLSERERECVCVSVCVFEGGGGVTRSNHLSCVHRAGAYRGDGESGVQVSTTPTKMVAPSHVGINSDGPIAPGTRAGAASGGGGGGVERGGGSGGDGGGGI